MSAFVVDTATMDYVLKAVSITDTSLTCAELDQIGRRFYQLNLDAVRTRYPECYRNADLPGFHGCHRMPAEYQYSPIRVLDHASTVAAYKAVKLLIYQCSEGDCFESPLYECLERTAGAIADIIVQALPSYSRA